MCLLPGQSAGIAHCLRGGGGGVTENSIKQSSTPTLVSSGQSDNHRNILTTTRLFFTITFSVLPI